MTLRLSHVDSHEVFLLAWINICLFYWCNGTELSVLQMGNGGVLDLSFKNRKDVIFPSLEVWSTFATPSPAPQLVYYIYRHCLNLLRSLWFALIHASLNLPISGFGSRRISIRNGTFFLLLFDNTSFAS